MRDHFNHWRQFHWLASSPDLLEQHLQTWWRAHPELHALPSEQVLLISNRSLLDLQPVAARRVHQYLGCETRLLIFDAVSGFHPDAFAQALGTLCGGGYLLLLTPPTEEWSAFDDPEYAVLRTWQYRDARPSGYFLARLACILSQHLSATDTAWHQLPVPSMAPPVSVATPPFWSNDQQQAVVRILHRLGQRRSISVVTADRGRGKSAALGLALALYQGDKPLRVCVTAPQRDAVASLFAVVARQLGVAPERLGELHHNALQLRYVLPEQVLNEVGNADVLVVDEAAALPVPLLRRWLGRFPHLLLATTLHGYEGNGQGFALRFLPLLRQQKQSWQLLKLEQPVRWPRGDPLETLSYRLLLLDAEPAPVSDWQDNDSLSYQAISAQALSTDEVMLQQVFGLLTAAHYRTTPNDLRAMLDTPGLHIRVLRGGREEVLGVMLVVDEGMLDEAISRAIWAGRRRPPGDLVPQVLMAQEGWREAGRWKGWRIMRIAVHPQRQAQGLGQCMLGELGKEAQRQGCDYLASSFAVHARLLNFWRQNSYTPVRLGQNRDPVTASWSALVMQPLTERVNDWLPAALTRFHQQLLMWLPHLYADLEDEVVIDCLAASGGAKPVKPVWLENVQGFACEQRHLDASLPELREWLLAHMDGLRLLSEAQRALVLARLLRLEGAAAAEARCQIAGAKAQLSALRQAVGQLLRIQAGLSSSD